MSSSRSSLSVPVVAGLCLAIGCMGSGVVFSLGCILTPAASAGTWHVDPGGAGDVLSIQAAVNAAVDGDTILIAPGQYAEGIGTTKGLHFRADAGGDVLWETEPGMACLYISDAPEASVHGIHFAGDVSGATAGLALFRNGGIVEVHDCVFENMTASWSGGGAFLSNQQTDMRRCVFRNITNNAGPDHRGGAVHVYSSEPASYIVDCTFENCNFNGRGGGLSVTSQSAAAHVYVEGCVFRNCTGERGGALSVYSGPATITGCAFEDNTATLNGGGIDHFYQFLEVQDCIFQGNVAASQGGALITADTGAEALIHDNLFWDNQAPEGGAVFCMANLVSLDRNTFFRNRATLLGAALAVTQGAVDIQRCIITESDGAAALHCTVEPTIGCCDFWLNFSGHSSGCSNFLGTAGNIESDPMLCNWHTADFQVAASSACASGNLPAGCAGQIGAYGVGCAVTPIHSVTWGQMRTLFLSEAE